MNDKNPSPDQQLDLSQKWEAAFRELLDQIYWVGYSEQLAKENLEAYQTEYFYFISLYDEPPPANDVEAAAEFISSIYKD